MEWSTVERIAQDPRTLRIAAPSLLVLVLLWFGFGALAIATCLSSLFLGVQTATWIAIDSNGNFLAALIEYLTGCQADEKKPNKPKEVAEDAGKRRKMPWEGIFVPSTVNESLESLLDQIVDQYVNNWYESGISRDKAFLNEIRYQIRYAGCRLAARLNDLDLPTVIAEEAIPISALHLHRIVKIEEELEEKFNSCPRSLIESQVCERLTDLHYVMGSRQNELNYLRQIADFLIPYLLDETRLAGRAHDDDSPAKHSMGMRVQRSWPSHSARHLIRELIVQSFLLPVLDLIADPDTINHLIILALDTQKGADTEKHESEPVCLLKGLTEASPESVPDSLLQLKLTEIIRDPRQYSMFRMYLSDTRGPVNELIFLAEATRIHESMQRKNDVKPLKASDPQPTRDQLMFIHPRSEQKILALESSSQIAYDIWQLYGQFVHESAPEKIKFEKEVEDQFFSAVESNDLEQLDKIIEISYQVIYQRMQVEHVVPFCQSESYLGYLCGSPPVSVIELIDKPATQRRNSVTEKSFSLSQLRSVLRRALVLSSSEGSIEGEDGGLEESSSPPLDSEIIASSSQLDSDGEKIDRTRAHSLLDGKERISEAEDAAPLTPSHSKSMPHMDLPSIDVSMAEAGVYDDGDGPISPASRPVSREDDELSSSSGAAGQPQEEQPVLVIGHDGRNMNQWKVAIGKVVPTRDQTTGRTIYVYAVEVDRVEAKENETKRWSILRRFNEFYILEAKLLEFHGEALRISPLPARKTFVTKNRAFMEQHRLAFSAFISSLCKQKLLHRSDLLFAFLTSPEEFRDSLLLSDLNPWKVVKKMPAKLSREKGQNLKPFLLSLLANTLAPPEKAPSFKEKVDIGGSDSSSLSSLSAAGDLTTPSLYSPIFGNNCPGCKIPDDFEKDFMCWSRSTVDAFLLLLHTALAQTSRWAFNIFASIRLLCRSSLDSLMSSVLRRTLNTAFDEQHSTFLIQLLQQSLFCNDGSVATEQEKALREELAKRRTLEFLQEDVPSHLTRILGRKSVRGTTKKLLHAVQYPRLNKQLSYVLLDVLITRLFPEES